MVILFFLAMFPSFGFGQGGNTLTIEDTVDPVNPCAFLMIWHNIVTGKAWVCIDNNATPPVGTWYQIYPGGSGVTSVTGTSPIISSGGVAPAISIANAAADGATKGAASFTATDFDAAAGNISIDYTNGQAASGAAKGFLAAADWTTFNNKVPSTRAVNTAAPLGGGGALSGDLSLTCAGCLTANQNITLSGDATGNGTTAITVTNVNLPNGVTQAGHLLLTDIAAPAAPAAAHLKVFGDSTDLRFHDKNAAGTIGTTVVADTGAANNFLTAISAAGAISKAQPSCSSLSNGAASCSTDTTNGSNISSGTVGAARLPGAGVTTINGISCTIGGTCDVPGFAYGGLLNNGTVTNTTQYSTGGVQPSATEAARIGLIPMACTMKNLYLVTNSANGAGILSLFLRKGTTVAGMANTAITLTVGNGAAAGTFTDLVNTVAMSAGDLWDVSFVMSAAVTSANLTAIGLVCVP